MAFAIASQFFNRRDRENNTKHHKIPVQLRNYFAAGEIICVYQCSSVDKQNSLSIRFQAT
jgi:hypothetical protein